MSKFQYVRVQYLQEEVFRTPADWDLKDIDIVGGGICHKGMLYILPKISIKSEEEVSDIIIEDDEGAIEQYKDEFEQYDESEDESEEDEKKEREAMQKEDKK